MPKAKPVTLTFQAERETKNKRRFQEDFAEGAKPVCDKLYVSKETLKEMGDPETLHVTITAP